MQTEDSDPHSNSSYQSLDPNIVVAERFVGMIVLGVLAFCGIIGWLFLAFFVLDGLGWKSLLSGLGILLFLIVLGTLFWFDPLWKLRSTHWRETDKGFELKRGYVWWHHIFVPRERIQHTDVVQGPILRRYGMATLVINTAGTNEYSISVEGLPLSQAESLRSSLLPKRTIAVSTTEATDVTEIQAKPTVADPLLKEIADPASVEPSDAGSSVVSSAMPPNVITPLRDGAENERT
jgi:membrane protein YdbS with pleckstrin-like domain